MNLSSGAVLPAPSFGYCESLENILAVRAGMHVSHGFEQNMKLLAQVYAAASRISGRTQQENAK
jgi:hypothetical protein